MNLRSSRFSYRDAITELRYSPKAVANVKLIFSITSNISQIERKYFLIVKSVCLFELIILIKVIHLLSL